MLKLNFGQARDFVGIYVYVYIYNYTVCINTYESFLLLFPKLRKTLKRKDFILLYSHAKALE